ncbi:hypothetical protein QTP88_022938 [Uroleucon formosanum]
MTGRINPCSRCLIEKCIISKVDDDPRDEITNIINVSQVGEESKRLQKLILKNRKEYWSSLATKKCIQPSTSTKPIVYKEEIVKRRFRRVDISRINDLAIPRRMASDVEQAPHKCNCCTVPLYMLLPRIERLSVPPRRTDITEHVKTDEDTFSVVSPTLYIPRTCSSFMVLHELFQLNVLSFYLSLLIWACRALKYNSMKINCNPFYLNLRNLLRKVSFYGEKHIELKLLENNRKKTHQKNYDKYGDKKRKVKDNLLDNAMKTRIVKKSALKYVASERLKRLATPRLMYQDDF